jgi:hypothetical protein
MSDLTDAFSFSVSDPDETPDECRTCDLKVCPHEYVLAECLEEGEPRRMK